MNKITDKRLAQLDEYRVRNGLGHTDMAGLFNVDPERYNNWRYRDSLPKDFYDTADNLIASDPSQSDIAPANQNDQLKPQQALLLQRMQTIFANTPPDKIDDLIDLLGCIHRFLK